MIICLFINLISSPEVAMSSESQDSLFWNGSLEAVCSK